MVHINKSFYCLCLYGAAFWKVHSVKKLLALCYVFNYVYTIQYVAPQQTTTGQQQQGTLGEGGILSLQYTLPSAGLTLTVNVAQGEVNIYGSYTIRNPTFFTADFMRSGSGVLQFHIPNIGAAGNTAFITLIAKEPVNTFTITATEGNTITLTGRYNYYIILWSCRMKWFFLVLWLRFCELF